MQRREGQNNGMAFLEVLVAMLVFALAVLPLVKLQLMSSEATMAGYYKTETSSVAQSIMEIMQKNRHEVANGLWNNVAVYAGEACDSITGGSNVAERKIACRILNDPTRPIHSAKNAVICIQTQSATYTPAGAISALNTADAYEIDLYAIWYAGKRNKKTYDQDLDQSTCSGLNEKKVETNYASKENLDTIIFKQVI